MVATFSQLFSQSWDFLRSHRTLIFLGGLVFALAMFAAQVLLHSRTASMMEQRFGSIERFSQLAERIGEGDEEAMNEMMEEMGMMGPDGEVDEEAAEGVALYMMSTMFPAFGAFFLVAMLLSLLAATYYIVVATEGYQDFSLALKRSFSVLFPFIGIWFWAMLRSFLWVPIVGIIPGIIIGPRLLLAPVVYLREKKGIVESVRVSYQRSRGYWGKIVGNLLLMGIIVFFVMAIAGGLTGALLRSVPVVSALAILFLQQVGVAFCNTFMVQLSSTVLSHPLLPGKVPARAAVPPVAVKKPAKKGKTVKKKK